MNIAEILKYCPKGTKLYSPTWGNVKLIEVTSDEVIKIKAWKFTEELTSDGRYSDKGECVLFPSKDQRDWSKFRLPVKRGDIMMMPNTNHAFIATGAFTDNGSIMFVCGIDADNELFINPSNAGWTSEFYIPSSEEAKEELFDKMAEAGYKWNTDTLELEKIESQFKEGDVVMDKDSNLCLVSKVEDSTTIIVSAVLYTDDTLRIYNGVYRFSKEITLASIEDRNKFYSTLIKEDYIYDKKQHKLVKQEFKPFDRVLVKDDFNDPWKTDILLELRRSNHYYYRCATSYYKLCIPYEGNEYLLGKTVNIH